MTEADVIGMCCGRFPGPDLSGRLACGWCTSSAPGSTPSTSATASHQTRCCRCQHARRQRAVGGRGNGAADAGGLAAASHAGSGDPRRPRLAVRPATTGETVRDIARATVGLVGYGKHRQTGSGHRRREGATVLHTSTGDDGLSAGDRLPELLLGASDIVSLQPAVEGRHRRTAGRGRAWTG